MKNGLIIPLAVTLQASVPTSALAGATVTLYPNLSPTRIPNIYDTVVNGSVPDYIVQSPSFDAYSANVIAALEAGQSSSGESQATVPTAFNTTTRTSFTSGETFATPFNSWRGDLAPTGAFAGEYGTFVRLATKIVSPTTFTLADVVETNSDSADGPTPFSFTLASQIPAYGLTAIGINYGADGRPGGGDDIVYNSDAVDPSTTPINELDYIGGGAFAFLTPEDFAAGYNGDAQAAFADYNGFIASFSPFDFATTISLQPDGVETASASFAGQITAVPEPATWMLAITGFAFIGAAMRRGRPDEQAPEKSQRSPQWVLSRI